MMSKMRGISTEDKLFYNGVMSGLSLIEKFKRFKQNLIDPEVFVTSNELESLNFDFASVV